MTWNYDQTDGRYYVEKAHISYTNFAGNENDMNQKGKRNFKLRIDEDLYNELIARGIQARMTPPRNDGDEPWYSVKCNVYPSSKIFLLAGTKTRVEFEDLKDIDEEILAGQVANGEIDVSFHVSVNTMLARPSYYIRVDSMYIPIRKNRFDKKYEAYGAPDVDDELPM